MKTMSSCTPVRKIRAVDSTCDAEIAKQVGQEVLENHLDPAAWATALSASGGKRQEALAAYARIRMRQLSAHRRLSLAKKESFDCRRVTKCFGIRTVQDLLQRNHPERQLNFLKPQISPISLIILWIGAAGCVGTMGRLLAGGLPGIQGMLPAMSLMIGGVAVSIAIAMRFLLPKRWIMLGWNTGLLMACFVACFASLLGGVKLIMQAAPVDLVAESSSHRVLEVKPAEIAMPAKAEPLLVVTTRGE